MQIQFPDTIQLLDGTQVDAEIRGDFNATRDPLGTGDSPTEYTFDYPQVFLPTKEEIPQSEYDVSDIQQRAIKFMKGY